jgi:hypothetical protein
VSPRLRQRQRRRAGLCGSCAALATRTGYCADHYAQSLARYRGRRAVLLAHRKRERDAKRGLGLCAESGCETVTTRYRRCLTHRARAMELRRA